LSDLCWSRPVFRQTTRTKRYLCKGKVGPFWPGGLDPIVDMSNDGSTKVGVKGLRTVPLGLKRGILLPAEKSSDPTSSELYDTDGIKVEDESLVIPLVVGLIMDSQTYNSPRRCQTSWKSNFCQMLCWTNRSFTSSYGNHHSRSFLRGDVVNPRSEGHNCDQSRPLVGKPNAMRYRNETGPTW
jgi:hypothetical protein